MNLNQQGQKKLAGKYTKVTEKLTKKVTTRTDKIIENARKRKVDSEKDDDIENDGGKSHVIEFSGETSSKKARLEGHKLVSSVGNLSLPEFEMEPELVPVVEPEVLPVVKPALVLEQGTEKEHIKEKKKTLKERREMDVVKVKKIGEVQKKTFKEAFNTDKTRLEKRQQKLNLPQDFLILVKDNVHDKIEGGSKTANKYLVYGKGAAKEMFLKEGLNYDMSKFYLHANNVDFTEEEVIKEVEEQEEDKDDDDHGDGEKEEEVDIFNMRASAKKVITPGAEGSQKPDNGLADSSEGSGDEDMEEQERVERSGSRDLFSDED